MGKPNLSKPILSERLPSTTSAVARQKLDGRRQAENLAQGEQMVSLLADLVAEQRRTNDLLQWFADRAHRKDGA